LDDPHPASFAGSNRGSPFPVVHPVDGSEHLISSLMYIPSTLMVIWMLFHPGVILLLWFHICLSLCSHSYRDTMKSYLSETLCSLQLFGHYAVHGTL
jgi:hypothetical protein